MVSEQSAIRVRAHIFLMFAIMCTDTLDKRSYYFIQHADHMEQSAIRERCPVFHGAR